jgi:diadenosine tetraphosphatase ApaH/serine/threonine PP2A family protein phosphatase
VGKPKDGDPRAGFAVLAADGAQPRVSIERVDYDAAAAAEQVREAGLPGEFGDKLVAAG